MEDNTRMPFITTSDLTFHYLDIGSGKPFLFQHGLGGDTQQTRDTFVPPAGWRLLTLDCRGHGETRPLGDPAKLGFDQQADDLLAFIDMLGLDRVAIGGISMGAGVALNFALRYPQRASALVLVRPAWLEQPLPPNLQVYPRIARLIRQEGAERGAQLFQRSAEYQGVLREYPATAGSLLKQFTRANAAEWVDILERMPADAPNRERAAWAQLRLPTLVLGNDRDPVHPFAYAETLARAIPGAQLERITSKEIDALEHTRDIQREIEGFFSKF
jgi:pimeloyl-ACP methyl ester carboxylesterase